nr:response regulator transcription factor [Actinomycetota bacterium]
MARTAPKPIRVLVADDHTTFAQALGIALRLEKGFVVEIASSAEEAVELAARTGAEVVFMDLEMPSMGGVEAIRQIKARMPSVPVIALSAHDEDLYRARALEAGAVGYLSKASSVAAVAAAARSARAGEILLDAEEAGRLLRQLRRRRHQDATERQRVALLTSRQAEILQLIADGLSSRTIADRLHVSHQTVRTHVQNILTRLSTHTKVQAVTLGIRQGKITPGGPGEPRSEPRPRSAS